MAIYYIGWCIPRFRTKKYHTEILGTPTPCILCIYIYYVLISQWKELHEYLRMDIDIAWYSCVFFVSGFWGPPCSIFSETSWWGPMVSPWYPLSASLAVRMGPRSGARESGAAKGAHCACQGLVKKSWQRSSLTIIKILIYPWPYKFWSINRYRWSIIPYIV